jgi:CSN8/PSMD8/EIF3K family
LHLTTRVRADAFALIGRAYSTVDTDKAAGMLGLSVDEVVAECTKAGWGVDGAFLLPVKPALVANAAIASGGVASAAPVVESEGNPSIVALSSLTEQLVRLQGC